MHEGVAYHDSELCGHSWERLQLVSAFDSSVLEEWQKRQDNCICLREESTLQQGSNLRDFTLYHI